jgi:phosphocarrier protein HPr
MVSEALVVTNRAGFHMRLAYDFVTAINEFQCAVSIHYRNREINGKSLMSVMAACIRQGSEIEICCTGSDEAEALKAAVQIICRDSTG